MNTFPASLASIHVNDWFFVSKRSVCQADGLIRAALNTGVTAGTVVIPHLWNLRTDDADIRDLGAGTGIGAVTQSDAQCMMGPDILSQRCFEKP
jgi:hypothetical protein